MNKYKYIILGSGIAAYGALEELLKETKSICLISKEGPTYLRPLLSKTTFTTYNVNVTYLPDIYSDITFVQEEIKVIDTNNKIINGKYEYETLIYALGAENKKMPIENGYYLRHVQDFYKIKRQLPFIESIGIIGGGMIGLEVADLLSKMHKKVHVYEYADLLVPRFFDAKDSDYLIKYLNSLGIRVTLSSRKSSYDEDLILVSVGNVKNNLLGEPIMVDDFMYFKDDIYACGDCVEKNHMLWAEAYQQGKVAAQNALGKQVVFEKKNYPVLFHLGNVGIYANTTELNGEVSKVFDEVLFSVADSAQKTYVSIHDHCLIVIGDLRYVDWIQEGRIKL